jgi:3-oxoacid CoA-transferase B subunit
MDAKEKIARRAVLELKDGAVTNIGLGIPNEVFKYLPKEVSPLLHAENGAVAVGPAPKIGQQQPYLSNAAGFPITLLPHGSVFDICTSQAIMRGGHVDVSIIGAMQVDQLGGIANWGTSPKPGKYVPGIGGAMD